MLATAATSLLMSCNVSNSTDNNSSINLNSTGLFPFQNNTNWWMYTESGGNKLSILVLDTITDNSTIRGTVELAHHFTYFFSVVQSY